MSCRKRPELAAEARRRNLEQLSRLGAEIRSSRLRRRLTQHALGRRVAVAQATISDLERGQGGSLSIDLWQRVALALDRPLRVELARDPNDEPADAGHLAIQELVLRLARNAGYVRTFELATRPSDPARSADVGLMDPRTGRLVLVECWNTIGNIGGAARASDRKRAEVEAFAAARSHDRPAAVFGCWVVRATRRNRALVTRYPEVFGARFAGSSARWRNALVAGSEPPAAPGLVWCDVPATRLFAWRRR